MRLLYIFCSQLNEVGKICSRSAFNSKFFLIELLNDRAESNNPNTFFFDKPKLFFVLDIIRYKLGFPFLREKFLNYFYFLGIPIFLEYPLFNTSFE